MKFVSVPHLLLPLNCILVRILIPNSTTHRFCFVEISSTNSKINEHPLNFENWLFCPTDAFNSFGFHGARNN